MSEPRYENRDIGGMAFLACLDCGALIDDRDSHTRFHSILGGHAWTLAVLKTAHVAAHIHDKYDTTARIDSKRFDSWSAGALAEVTGETVSAEFCEDAAALMDASDELMRRLAD
jgi:5-methylcytosine-specific restriction endonuclease McrA